ncbi:MAG TPA: hypothetical protein VK856_01260 [Anaerolineaceae bacterium]|nr:hypothetical protein [Anaerolineaceae bacterium]
MIQTRIQIKGILDQSWADWFGEMEIQFDQSGDSILIGNLPDKSAVYGMVSRLSSLGITLISLTCQEEKTDIPLNIEIENNDN